MALSLKDVQARSTHTKMEQEGETFTLPRSPMIMAKKCLKRTQGGVISVKAVLALTT